MERRLSARVFVVAFLPPDAPDDPEQGGSTQKDEGQKQVESARHVPFPLVGGETIQKLLAKERVIIQKMLEPFSALYRNG